MPIETGQEPVRHYLRNEANEVQTDARPQSWKNRRRIRWNTLRIFSGRERRSCRSSFAAVERSMSNRLLGRKAETD